MYRKLVTVFLFNLYIILGLSQVIRRTSSGDEIYSGTQECLNCASFLDSSASEKCSKKCKCKGTGTVLPSDGNDGLYVCSRPTKLTVSLVYGCSFNLLAASELSIPFMSSSWDAIPMVAEKGLGNFRGCVVSKDSYYWGDEKWKSLFTGDRQINDFAIRVFRGKAFLQMKESTNYNGLLIKLGIQCDSIAPSCLMFKVEGKATVNLKPEQLVHSTSAHASRQRRDVNNSTSTTQSVKSSTPTPTPTPTSTVTQTTEAPSTNKVPATNGTDIPKKKSESDNKVLLYLAMVCGAALVLVIIPVIGIAINNRRKQRKVKKAAATQKKSNDGEKNGEISVIPGDRRSRSSTATVNVEDNTGSQVSSVKSSRRGSLDPAALTDIRRQSMTSLRIQDTRRGSTIEQQRPRSVAEMRRGSLPVNELRPYGFSELRTPDLRDLRLQSLSNVRSVAPLTPDFRRSQSASDPRVQRLNSNALRESMAGIEELEHEYEDGLLNARMLDPRRNSMISLRSVSSTSALPDADRDEGSRSPRTISNLLDETEKRNALGENKFSPQPARKISANDISYNSLPSRKLSMNMPDRDYEEMNNNNNNKSEDTDDDVFKLKSITPNEPSYTKFFK